MKEMAREPNQRHNLSKVAAKDTLETTHLKMLKWVLGVHKKTNNNFCYGDTGRMPWALSVLPQCLRYFGRLSRASSETNSVNFLVSQAFQEQKNLNLSWYEKLSSVAHYETEAAHGTMRDVFISDWRVDLGSQTKMQFYNQIKEEFGEFGEQAIPNEFS